MLRRLTRHPRTQAATAWASGAYLSLVARTTRWTMVGAEHVTAVLASGEAAEGRRPGVIAAFWHERLGVMPLGWYVARQSVPLLHGARAHVLVSQHRDGRLIGEIVGRFALSMVYGSTTRGGATGLIALARLLASGDHVAITPDGPRGPRRRAALGVAHLAALTGRPVVPLGCAIAPARILKTWDRMMVPLPFGRGALVVGAPITVPRDGAEAMLPDIEAALSEVCDRADVLAAGGARRTAATGVQAA